MIQTYTDLASHQTVPLLQNRTFNVWAMISHIDVDADWYAFLHARLA